MSHSINCSILWEDFWKIRFIPSASEMRTLYQIVEKKISSLELTDDDRIWLKYIKALCNYNMVDLQETVRYLLPLETDIEANYLNQFLLTSFFISAYVTGDTSGAAGYWGHYRQKDDPDIMTKLTYGLIVKNSQVLKTF